MGSSITVSGDWLRGIQSSLAVVETSGAAYAAIWASKDFADSAAAAVKEGGSWWSPDPWRTSAAQQLEEAGIQITREESPYREGSSTLIDREAWSRVAGKISNVYALAKFSRDAFPEGAETDAFDGSLIEGAALLAQAVLDSPREAVNYLADVAGDVAEKTGDAAKRAVRAAAGVAKEATAGIASAVDAAIPWRALLVGGLILGAVVGGVVLLAKTGAIKQIGGIAHG
jgi:hypothetical protein